MRWLAFISLVLGTLALGGCRVESFTKTTLRTHEGLSHSFCAESGGEVQVNIGPCSIQSFPFYVELSGPTFEAMGVRGGEQRRFKTRVDAGQCANVNIVNMDDGSLGAPTCDFHVYWDL